MSNNEFMGMLVASIVVLVGLGTVIFKFAAAVTKFQVAVEHIVEWKPTKDLKDKEQDDRLDEHDNIFKRNNLK